MKRAVIAGLSIVLPAWLAASSPNPFTVTFLAVMIVMQMTVWVEEIKEEIREGQ